jgi:hypothetical protein
VATASEAWQGFRHWRRRRPFWGGLLLLLAGMELFLSANLTLGGMEVHVGPQGFLSYVLPLILVLCGLLTWFTPAQRLFYGILGLLTALYSLLGLNLGGFFAGMLIGIVGGALTIAWAPVRPTAAGPVSAAASVPAASAASASADEPDPDHEPDADDAQTQFLPGFSDPEAAPPVEPSPEPVAEGEPPNSSPSGGVHRKTFVIALVPIAVTAAVLIGGSQTPARAATCPEGLPSRSTTASASPSDNVAKKAATPAKTTTAPKKTTSAAKTTTTTTPSPSAPASAAASDTSILDGIKDGVTTIVDGVGKLLGIGDDASPTPSTSPSETAGPSATPTPAPTTSAPAGEPSQSASQPGASSGPSGSASPSPSPTPTDIPCLGARVMGKVAGPDDVPLVTAKGGTLETDSLTMYNSTYDGVSTLDTGGGGTVQALKFSMTKAVNKPFKLTVPEADGHTTLIESDELTTDGKVRFYTPSFKGKLFGVIPVLFTPEQPPPPTLPVLWFTDVTINLTFVRCDTLTAKPLTVTEKP